MLRACLLPPPSSYVVVHASNACEGGGGAQKEELSYLYRNDTVSHLCGSGQTTAEDMMEIQNNQPLLQNRDSLRLITLSMISTIQCTQITFKQTI